MSWPGAAVRRPEARRGACIALLLAAPLALQAETAPQDDFAATAMPPGVPARFVCHQSGTQIVEIERVATFLPARIQGVMSFSLTDRAGRTHLLYLDTATTCRLEVAPPS